MPALGFGNQLSRGAIGTRITDLFFDSTRVRKAADDGTRRVLSRFGFFVRSDARRSLRRPRRKPLSAFTRQEREDYRRWQRRYRQGKSKVKPQRPFIPSEPGTPPRNQSGLLKGFIFFTYEPLRRSVVIGPARLAGSKQQPPVPEVLEYGGLTFNRKAKRWIRIAARPFMRPAFTKQLEKNMPGLWKNAIR